MPLTIGVGKSSDESKSRDRTKVSGEDVWTVDCGLWTVEKEKREELERDRKRGLLCAEAKGDEMTLWICGGCESSGFFGA